MYGPRSTARVLVPAPVTWAYAVLLTDVEYWNNNDRIPRISNEIPKIPVIFRVSPSIFFPFVQKLRVI